MSNPDRCRKTISVAKQDGKTPVAPQSIARPMRTILGRRTAQLLPKLLLPANQAGSAEDPARSRMEADMKYRKNGLSCISMASHVYDLL